jgi:hypothetical protein
MWGLFRKLRFSATTRTQPTARRAATPNATARWRTDRKLAKGVLSRGRPRIQKLNLPDKPVIYRHLDPKTNRPYHIGATFNAAARIPNHSADAKLRKMSVGFQVARASVTPRQLQATERLKIKKHGTMGKGNVYAGGNGNIPKRFRSARLKTS